MILSVTVRLGSSGSVLSGYIKTSDGLGIPDVTIVVTGRGENKITGQGCSGPYSYWDYESWFKEVNTASDGLYYVETDRLDSGNVWIEPQHHAYIFSPSILTIPYSIKIPIWHANFTGYINHNVLFGQVVKPNGDPFVGITVSYSDEGSSFTRSTLTDEDGYYYFYGLDDGNYTVFPDDHWHTLNPAAQLVSIIGGDVQASPFTLSGFNARGVLQFPADSFSKDAEVYLSGTAEDSTASDENGDYVFRDLQSGPYLVTPVKECFVFSPDHRSFDIVDDYAEVEDISAIIVEGRCSQVNGQLVSSDGTPLTNGVVNVTAGGQFLGSVLTGRYASTFTIYPLPAGAYTLDAQRSFYNFHPVRLDAAVSEQSVEIMGNPVWGIEYGIWPPESPYYGYVDDIEETVDAGHAVSARIGGVGTLIFKIDNEGEIVWQRGYRDYDPITSIASKNNGNLIVAGTRGSTVFLSEMNNFLGSTLWQVIYNSEGGLRKVDKVVPLSSGDILLSGQNSFGSWLMKVDNQGQLLWHHVYDESRYSSGKCLVLLSTEGEYFLATDTNFFGAGKRDLLVMKLDQDGQIQWQKTYGSSDNEHLAAIDLTSDEQPGLLLAASKNIQGGTSNSDIWMLKLDLDGGIVWQKTYGGDGYDRAIDMVAYPDGGLLISGTGQKWDTQDIDYFNWFFKLDNEGNLQWTRNRDGYYYYSIDQIDINDDGSYIVGYSGINSKIGLVTEGGTIPSKLDLAPIIQDTNIMVTASSAVMSTLSVVAMEPSSRFPKQIDISITDSWR